jgi:hypothetical protein
VSEQHLVHTSQRSRTAHRSTPQTSTVVNLRQSPPLRRCTTRGTSAARGAGRRAGQRRRARRGVVGGRPRRTRTRRPTSPRRQDEPAPEPTDIHTPADEPAPEPTDIHAADEPAPTPDRPPHPGRRARARARPTSLPRRTSSRTRFPPRRRPASGHPVAPASPHPERWGRVDADGTVYVNTARASERSARGRPASPPRASRTSPAASTTCSPRPSCWSPAVVGRGRPQAHAVQRAHPARRSGRGARRRRRRGLARCSTAW